MTAPVVCFGPIIRGLVLAVDHYPTANAGAFVSRKDAYIGADAPMIALTLARWGIETRLICNDLGDDDAGRATQRALRDAGVATDLTLRPELGTPLEVDVCDRAGTRTWFVEGDQRVWDTIIGADRASIRDARLVYVDWYARPVAGEIAALAAACGRPLFLNVEYSLSAPNTNAEMLRHATTAQNGIEESASLADAIAIGQAMIGHGVRHALVTRGSHGCVAVSDGTPLVVPAPRVDVAATIGAGAAFAAGFIYAQVQGWDFARAVRFAVAAGSLKCMSLVPTAATVADIEAFMRQNVPG